MDRDRAGVIARRLEDARRAYYNSDRPLMSDAEFDALEESLRALDPDHSYFTTVGTTGPDGLKIRHRVPMLSMGKAKNLDEVGKWLRRLELPAGTALAVQPKIDGLSAALFYRDGRLEYAATRGDGITGADVSHIIPYIDSLPRGIGFTREAVEIRGELHLPRDTAYDTGGKPLRNNCVGLVNRKDGRDDLRFVRFLAYQIVWPDSGHLSSGAAAAPDAALAAQPSLASEAGKIALLAGEGFTTFDCRTLSADPAAADPAAEMVSLIGDIYREYIDVLRDQWNFETDGLILVVDDNRLHDAIDARWVVDHHHHYALAFKPPSEAAETTLRDIVWQVSRQGSLTPVALFDPLEMGGATLERASLHNAANVKRLRIARGDRILVERANDVIPYVRENRSGSGRDAGFRDGQLWPAVCPSCAAATEERGVNLVCPNSGCRDRVLQTILYWVRQAEVEQVALKTLEALYDAGKLRKIADLYALSADDFDGLEGFGEKKITNFLSQVASARSMTAVDLISRLGIPMVQKKSLARLGIVSMEDFRAFSDESYAVGRTVVQWKSDPDNLAFLDELLGVVNLIESRTADKRLGVICLTGTAPVGRKILVAALENRGWTVADAVTRDTVKVVCDDPSGSSTKLKKARQAGIEIVTYGDFLAAEGLEGL